MKARHVVPQGSLNKFGWLTITNVTSPLTSHQDSLRDPFVAFAPRFLLGSSPVAHSLTRTSTPKSRCDFFAQNDIQWVCFVIIVRDGTSRAPSPTKKYNNPCRGGVSPPAFILDMRLFSGGASPSPTRHNKRDSKCTIPLLFLRTVEDALFHNNSLNRQGLGGA